ncbi:MAG TPA: NAD-dependent epimerase/dehydratase family protein [Ignavibacteriaceae bacterium]|nr:NAD-dependent epimerase/dehydratase family protein [Ignavibacteriaceae bacterium]
MGNNIKHIILGAGGAIGNTLANELKSKGEKIKLVSRSGKNLDGIEAAKADLTIKDETLSVIEDSSIVYLVAGLPYDYSIWEKQWFKIMQNVVEACKKKNARLIFFDNIYSYGKVDGAMTEETPYKPCSKKGELRAKLNKYLEDEMKAGNIKAIIARAADFYGPYSEKTSVPFILGIQNLAKGKKAQWLVDTKPKHSYTYTIDCGKALYLLATTDSAWNQVWHLPTAKPALTGDEFIKIVAENLNVKPGAMILKGWMIKLTGLFSKQIGELHEMLYQNKYDYIFDSSKFEKHFDFKPTPYEEGIKETIRFAKYSGVI